MEIAGHVNYQLQSSAHLRILLYTCWGQDLGGKGGHHGSNVAARRGLATADYDSVEGESEFRHQDPAGAQASE